MDVQGDVQCGGEEERGERRRSTYLRKGWHGVEDGAAALNGLVSRTAGGEADAHGLGRCRRAEGVEGNSGKGGGGGGQRAHGGVEDAVEARRCELSASNRSRARAASRRGNDGEDVDESRGSSALFSNYVAHPS